MKKGQPPLAVSSTKLVEHLNAQLLGGRGASFFAPKSYAYSKQQSDGKYAPAARSPNYLNASGVQLLGVANIADESILGAAATFYTRDFVAPAAGTIVMDLAGYLPKLRREQPDPRDQPGGWAGFVRTPDQPV